MKSLISLLKDLYERSGVDWVPEWAEEAKTLRDAKSYYHYDNKKLVGFCQIWDGDTVYHLVVDEKYRNQGIASALLRQVINNGAKYLFCAKQNVSFYVNRGFKVHSVAFSEYHGARLYYMKKTGED